MSFKEPAGSEPTYHLGMYRQPLFWLVVSEAFHWLDQYERWLPGVDQGLMDGRCWDLAHTRRTDLGDVEISKEMALALGWPVRLDPGAPAQPFPSDC